MLGKMSSVVTIVENFRKRSVCLFSFVNLYDNFWFVSYEQIINYTDSNRICSKSNTSLGSRLVIHRYAPPCCKSSWIWSFITESVLIILGSFFVFVVTGADPFHHDGSSPH